MWSKCTIILIVWMGLLLWLIGGCSQQTRKVSQPSTIKAPQPRLHQNPGNSTPKASLIVAGHVVDPLGRPVAGAVVRSAPPSATTATNTAGEFMLDKNLKPQEYIFYAVDSNGHKGTLRALVQEGQPLVIKIVLGAAMDITTMQLKKKRETFRNKQGKVIMDPK